MVLKAAWRSDHHSCTTGGKGGSFRERVKKLKMLDMEEREPKVQGKHALKTERRKDKGMLF